MSRRFFSGTTVEQALLMAARHYGMEPDQIGYNLRDKKHGFLNLRRKVVIEVDPDAPERVAEAPAPVEEAAPAAEVGSIAEEPTTDASEQAGAVDTTVDQGAEGAQDDSADASEEDVSAADADHRHDDDRRERRPRRPRGRGRGRGRDRHEQADHRPKPTPVPVTDDPLEAADQSLDELAELMLFDLQWEISLTEDDQLLIDLSGDDTDLLTEDDGQVLRAIEHLVPRMVRGKLGRGMPCKVDCDGFHDSHADALEKLAEQVAEEVRSSQQSQLLDPMTPADRRLIHVALADDPSVETASEGMGFSKQVRVSPAE